VSFNNRNSKNKYISKEVTQKTLKELEVVTDQEMELSNSKVKEDGKEYYTYNEESGGFLSWIVRKNKPLPTKSELNSSKKSGYLMQNVGLFSNNWKKRKFFINGSNMYYFDKEESNEADGIIPLTHATVEINLDNQHPKYIYQFIIYPKRHKPVYLCSLTEKNNERMDSRHQNSHRI